MHSVVMSAGILSPPMDDGEAFADVFEREEKGIEGGADSAGEAPEDSPDDGESPSGADEEMLEASEGEDANSESSGDDEDSEELGEDEEWATLHTLTVNGEEIEVSTDELKAGYMQQASFTQKSQELARERDRFQADRSQFEGERQAVADRVGPMVAEAQRILQREHARIDALRVEDPATYAAEMADLQRDAANLQRLDNERVALEEGGRQANVQAEQSSLMRMNPAFRTESGEWNKGEYQKLTDWVYSKGISAELWSQITDHCAVNIAHMAMQSERATRAVSKVKKNQQGTRRVKRSSSKTIRPGVARTPREQRGDASRAAEARFAKSGSVEDAADVFASSGLFNDR